MAESLLIFARSIADQGLGDPARLAELLSATESLTVSWTYFDDLIYDLSQPDQPGLYDTRTQRSIQGYDSVYFRHWSSQAGHANAAARICEQLGIPFIDREVLDSGSRNKLSQYVRLAQAGVSLPQTLIGTASNLQGYYADAGFQLPFIMKDKSGTRGQTNFLVTSTADFERIATEHSDTSFVLQDFIPNDGDFRVYIVGGVVKLLIQRTAVSGSHLNNISQGGSAELVPLETLPAEVLDMSLRAAALFGRDVAGVDIVCSTADSQYYCFEVNRAPQIEAAAFEHEKAAALGEYLASL